MHMIFSKILSLVFAIILFGFLACNNKKEVPADQQEETSIVDTASKDQSISATPADGNPEQHFICPNHCKGSGGAEEGKCPVCGTEYVHNDAFHRGAPIPEPQMKIDPVTHMAVPTHTEAQNAKGVYHFICPKGCPGGAGIAGNCPKCGTPLEHNQAFHAN